MINGIYALGRICLSLFFIAAGVQKASDVVPIARALEGLKILVPDEIVPYLAGIPKYEALGYLIAAIEIICGLMVLIGVKARWGALVLAVFAGCAIAFVHDFWAMEGAAARTHQTLALMQLAMLGGLLLVVAVGSRIAPPERETT